MERLADRQVASNLEFERFSPSLSVSFSIVLGVSL